MTAKPTPSAFRPDFSLPSPVPRDTPASDFLARMEQSGANADFLDSIRRDW
jgi:hypothetical protein